MKNRRLFSQKGNPPGYNYHFQQLWFTVIMALLVGLMILGVRLFGG